MMKLAAGAVFIVFFMMLEAHAAQQADPCTQGFAATVIRLSGKCDRVDTAGVDQLRIGTGLRADDKIKCAKNAGAKIKFCRSGEEKAISASVPQPYVVPNPSTPGVDNLGAGARVAAIENPRTTPPTVLADARRAESVPARTLPPPGGSGADARVAAADQQYEAQQRTYQRAQEAQMRAQQEQLRQQQLAQQRADEKQRLANQQHQPPGVSASAGIQRPAGVAGDRVAAADQQYEAQQRMYKRTQEAQIRAQHEAQMRAQQQAQMRAQQEQLRQQQLAQQRANEEQRLAYQQHQPPGVSAPAAIPRSAGIAADRETLSFAEAAPSAQQIEQFLFPEAHCEKSHYQCLAMRPSTERSIGDVKFHSGSSDLTPEAQAQLETVGKVLASQQGRLQPGEIVIEGHTDARGSAEFNQKLSEQRAETVAAHLVRAYGVNRKVLRPIGRGKVGLKDPSQPDSEVNRRVELVRTAR